MGAANAGRVVWFGCFVGVGAIIFDIGSIHLWGERPEDRCEPEPKRKPIGRTLTAEGLERGKRPYFGPVNGTTHNVKKLYTHAPRKRRNRS